MTPASVSPSARPAPVTASAAGLAPERVIEIDASRETRTEPRPLMSESRLAESVRHIRLR